MSVVITILIIHFMNADHKKSCKFNKINIEEYFQYYYGRLFASSIFYGWGICFIIIIIHYVIKK